MSWQILIAGNAFLIALSALSMRAIAKQKNAAHSAFAVNAGVNSVLYLVGLVLLIFLPAVNPEVLWHYWPWFILGGLAFTLMNACTYKVLSYLDAGITGVLGTIGILFTLIFAAIVLHEDLNTSQAVGGLILLSAICYILIIAKQPGSHHHRHPKSWLLGLMFTVLAGIFFGAAVVNEKFLLGHANNSSYIAFGWGGQMLMSLLIALIYQPQQLKILLKPQILSLTLAGGVTRSLGGFMFILALIKSNNVALMTVASNFRIVIIILLGALLLKERQKMIEKLAAAFLAMAGLGIIFWK